MTANAGFLKSTSATLTNGTSTVLVTGSVDCSHVSSGTAIFLNGSQIMVEGISGTAPDGSGNSTITIREPFTGVTQTGVSMTAFNTIEGLRDAIRRAREVVDGQSNLSTEFATFLTATGATKDLTINGTTVPVTPYGYLSGKVNTLLASIEDGTFFDGTGTNSYLHNRTSQAGFVPTASTIGVGEIFINLTDKKLFSKTELGTVFEFALGSGSGGGGGGSSTTPFIGLPDTPNSYVGQSGKLLAVNGDGNGLEFVDPSTASGGGGGGRTVSMYQHGLLSVHQGKAVWYPPESQITVSKIEAYVETAPKGSDIIIQLRQNGIPIGLTSGGIISILNNQEVAEANQTSLTFSSTDKITIDVTQVGITYSGTNLTVRLTY